MFRLSVFILERFLTISANVAISKTNSSSAAAAAANVTGDEQTDRAENSNPWPHIKKYFKFVGC